MDDALAVNDEQAVKYIFAFGLNYLYVPGNSTKQH